MLERLGLLFLCPLTIFKGMFSIIQPRLQFPLKTWLVKFWNPMFEIKNNELKVISTSGFRIMARFDRRKVVTKFETLTSYPWITI